MIMHIVVAIAAVWGAVLGGAGALWLYINLMEYLENHVGVGWFLIAVIITLFGVGLGLTI